MSKLPDLPLEYLWFALFFIVALSGISLWLRARGCSGRLIAIGWGLLVVVLVPGWFLVEASEKGEVERGRDAIMGMAPTYAADLVALGHHRIRHGVTQSDDPLYRAMIRKQRQWLEQNPTVHDIYTFRRPVDGTPGNALIVDSETDYDGDDAIDLSPDSNEMRTEIGEVWDEDGPYLEMAYAGDAVFDPNPYEDRWGRWVSAYVPMRHPYTNEVDAVLGVDFDANLWEQRLARARWLVLGPLAALLVTLLSLFTVIGVLRANLHQRQRDTDRTRAIIDQAHEAFVVMDDSGCITDWNPQSTAVFGWQREEVLGKEVAGLLMPERYREAHERGMRRFLETGQSHIVGGRIDVTGLHKDGHEIPLEMTITAIQEGGRYRFQAFLHDITERQEKEQQLRQAKEDAEAATRVKSEFIASVSHEIRTPLNGILGMGELLQSTELDARQARYLGQLQQSSETLLHLLNDVLDMSKVEAGRIELESRPFDVLATIEAVIQAIRPKAEQKGLQLSSHVDADVPRVLHGDPARLAQVLANLLSNAVKFTREGSIEVHAAVEAAIDDDVLLRFAVSDTGIGISPDRQERIFEAFRQEDATTTRRYGGTGLGLSICRHLVTRMGGEITVKSVVEGGSTFTFTSRFRPGTPEDLDITDDDAAAPGPEAATPAVGTLRVLLAEDGKVNQQVAVGLLGLDGHQVDVVEDGKQAVTAVRQGEYDVVLMDLQMPVMDGLDATRVIRELEGPDGPHVPIVAVTAIAMHGDRDRCIRAGMNAYLAKPIDRAELQATLAEVTDRDVPLPAPERAPSPTPAMNPDGPLIDWAVAARRIPGGASGIQELAELMQTEGPRLFAEMTRGFEERNAEAVRLAAHTLRGSVHHFGGGALIDATLAVEASARDEAFDAVQAQLPEVESLLAIFGTELEGAAHIDLAEVTDG